MMAGPELLPVVERHDSKAAIVGDAAPGGPWNAARVAIEMADFNEAIERLEPNAVYLSIAFALDDRRAPGELRRIFRQEEDD